MVPNAFTTIKWDINLTLDLIVFSLLDNQFIILCLMKHMTWSLKLYIIIQYYVSVSITQNSSMVLYAFTTIKWGSYLTLDLIVFSLLDNQTVISCLMMRMTWSLVRGTCQLEVTDMDFFIVQEFVSMKVSTKIGTDFRLANFSWPALI